MMFLHKLKNCCLTALPTAWKSTAWLLKLMIPISLAITLLQHTGLLAKIALCLHPLFVHLGLPGASAVAFLSGATAGTYAGIAAMMSMPLTMKQATILSMMIALCHALPMECAVNRMTGSSFWKMATIRVLMAGLCGLLLNPLLPAADASFIYLGAPADSTLQEVCVTWMLSQVKMSLMVFFIIYCLMTLQRLLEAYALLKPLSYLLSPLMRLFGLPTQAAYMWLVGNVLGISYGAAAMLELEKQGVITREEANEANYHLIMNHSLVEDTIVFGATGISAVLLVTVRITAALILVWGRKAFGRLAYSQHSSA